jgi:hypothetical protein
MFLILTSESAVSCFMKRFPFLCETCPMDIFLNGNSVIKGIFHLQIENNLNQLQ